MSRKPQRNILHSEQFGKVEDVILAVYKNPIARVLFVGGIGAVMGLAVAGQDGILGGAIAGGFLVSLIELQKNING